MALATLQDCMTSVYYVITGQTELPLPYNRHTTLANGPVQRLYASGASSCHVLPQKVKALGEGEQQLTSQRS